MKSQTRMLALLSAGVLSASLWIDAPTASANLLGDVDNNGTVDVSDAVETLTYYAKCAAGLDVSSEYTEDQITSVDVNADGTVDVSDAVSILTYYAKAAAGLDPKWDIETTTTTTTTTTITTETPISTETETTTLQTHANGAVIPPNTGDLLVILNTSTMCYHLSSDCRAAKKINTENYAEVQVASVSDVEQYGYQACGICAK